MSNSEFSMVMKVFHHRSSDEINKIFEDYAEVGLVETAPYVKYFNLETF